MGRNSVASQAGKNFSRASRKRMNGFVYLAEKWLMTNSLVCASFATRAASADVEWPVSAAFSAKFSLNVAS